MRPSTLRSALVFAAFLCLSPVAAVAQSPLPPLDSKLTPEQSQAFMAFENTDMKLKKSFPTMSDTQRQSMAREVLRDKGLLPKQKRAKR